jgi:hypothetical protein
MNTTALIRLAIAILMPASLCAADRIKIETKILESKVIKIPHNFAVAAKLKDVDLLKVEERSRPEARLSIG